MPALHALPHQLCRCLSSALAHLANTLWPHRVLLKRIRNQGKAVVSLLPTCTRCALTSWQEAGQRLQTTATCSLADHCECLKTKGHGCRGRHLHDAPGYKPGKYLTHPPDVCSACHTRPPLSCQARLLIFSNHPEQSTPTSATLYK